MRAVIKDPKWLIFFHVFTAPAASGGDGWDEAPAPVPTGWQ